MTRINTNIGTTRGLRNLNKANSQLDKSLQRLSTGSQINSGADNPSGLIAGEKLKLQVTTIEQSIKNSNRASNVLATADGALGEISGLLNQVRGLVQEGLNEGALSNAEIEANQLQIDAALSAINRISANTSFAGDKLIDGSKAFNTTVTSADAAKLSDFKVNEALIGSNTSVSIDATVTSAAEKAQIRYDGGALTAQATLEVGGAGGNEVLFLGDSASVSDIQTAINGVTESTGVTARTLAGVTITEAADASTLTVDSTNALSDVTFTRATGGTDATLGGTVDVVFADPGANNATLGVVVTTSGGDSTVTVNLATDGAGAITSTAADVEALINADGSASALVSATSEGAGSGVVEAVASGDLTGGLDSGTISFNDLRDSSALGNISVVFADPGANNATLGIVATANGDDTTITVNLATDGTGAITSTLDDIATAIGAETTEVLADGTTTVAAALEATATGGASNPVTAVASTALSTANGTSLVLESSDFGTNKFVDVNVLGGTFATTEIDGTTEARRDTGVDIGVVINGQNASTDGLSATIRTNGLDATINFEVASNTVAETASVSVTGGGSLFQIGQEVSSSGQLSVGIEAVNTARLGGITGKLFELGSTGGKSLLDIGAGVSGGDLVAIVDEALDRVSTIRGRLGAIQKNVIETNIASLGVALENISEARSQIVDTDFAVETANLTKSQILSQAGISVLSIANQRPQQVLSLLG
ncbi:MAG: flagellin [Planctomycetaceae bacterium]|jgi:flagellin